MNDINLVKYTVAYTKAVKALEELYNQNQSEDEAVIRNRIHMEYACRKLDPDAKAIRNITGKHVLQMHFILYVGSVVWKNA